MHRYASATQPIRPWRRLLGAFTLVALAASVKILSGQACDPNVNAVLCENQLAGNPASEWDVSGSGDATIQGFATDISVNRGSSVKFKVTTTAAAFNVNIYRLGYYGGMGARKITTISNVTGKNQAACLTNSSTGLIDCGNWTQSTSWTVPSTAASGVYIARLSRTDTGGASHIVFIVRDDSSHSDVVFQTSDTTWQAYNQYGGKSLYVGGPGTNPSRAYKVSYNRPFTTRGATPLDWLFNAEYPAIRFLEANGYNVSYTTGMDSDRRGNLLTNHKIFVSTGHDEYWSGAQRTNVEAARAAGVHMVFMSGNEVFWKTRWENSIDGTSTTYRTLVSYKETHANAKLDPSDPPTWTGTWMDPRFSPPADGGRPQNALTGTLFTVNCCTSSSTISVDQTYSALRFWRNTRVATLSVGDSTWLGSSLLGYEWDADIDNGFRPGGLFDLSATDVTASQKLQDYGSTYASGTATHQMTMYRHSSGALVFSAGTVEWAWGLDDNHDQGSGTSDNAVQQAMVNLLADMNAQPTTLQPGLVPATASTDTTAPVATITSPPSGTVAPLGVPLTISGTATDSGGGVVTTVEVSVDGGSTWHRVSGISNWSYTWTPTTNSVVAVKSRAVDDSANIQSPPGSVTIQTGSGWQCPCTIWPASATPAAIQSDDNNAVEIGVRFRSDVGGTISGIRYYKDSGNTGTHVGSLWSDTGTLLAQATFSGETSSGWQQVTFPAPIAIAANTTYVASYHANTGNYAVDSMYFAGFSQDRLPLHAPADGLYGLNGLYRYTASSAFPNQTYNSENYWVDVVFNVGAGDATPPTVAVTAPAAGSTVSGTTVAVSATASDNVGVVGVQFKLDGVNLGAEDTASPYSVTWNSTTATTGSHTLTAVARDAAGNTTTSAGVTVTVNNDSTPPTVAVTAPTAGSTVSGTAVAVSATASDNVGVVGVQFKLDGANLGAEATTSPYGVTWNSTTATTGNHTLTAVARDAAGNTTTSAGVTVTVNNDPTPPTVAVTAPTAGSTVSGTTVAVSATASDNVGVVGVQFKLDGVNLGAEATTSPYGVTWNSITATNGSHTLTAVARDAAGNTTTSAGIPVTVSNNLQVCPCTIWQVSATPALIETGDHSAVELGVRFRADVSGTITGIRFYKGSGNTGTHVGTLWTDTGTSLATATFSGETASGWQQVTFPTPVAITANTTYVASYHTNTGNYGVDTLYFKTAGADNAPLHAPTDGLYGFNGMYAYSGSSTFPNQTYQSANYWVDVVLTTPAGDTTAPTVAMTAPSAGTTVSGTAVVVSATASDNVGVVGVQFKLDGANLGAEDTTLPYAVAWDSTTATNGSHTLTAVARDAAGNTTTSSGVTVTVSNDSTPPTVALTSPAGGATVSGASVAVSATASDNVGVVGVQFKLDGVNLGVEDTTSPYTITWDSTTATNGSHTLTAAARDAAGNTTTSAGVAVTVNNVSVATLSIDAVAWGDQLSPMPTVTTSAFSTTAGSELLLAFVTAADPGTSNFATSVTGGSLTWELVLRTNAQPGTSEVWRAFAPDVLTNVTVTATLAHTATGSLTVVTFIGADPSGTNGSAAIGATASASALSGAPGATVTTTRNSSWVFGAGNDWDQALARTLGPNQTMVHQALSSVGDTFWVQRITSTTPGAGTNVTVNDTGPTTDRYNFSAVEVLPATGDSTAPFVVAASPLPWTTGVAVTAPVTVTFSEPMLASSINGTTITLRNSANALVAASVTYDTPSATARLTPTASLAAGSLYTFTITGATDLSGHQLQGLSSWSFTTVSTPASPTQGGGGPILVVTTTANPFTQYYVEILHAEGLNEFATADVSQLSSSLLAGYRVVLLGEQTLTTSQVTTLTNWVSAGGHLIAARPDSKLSTLLGLASKGATLSNAYLLINTSAPPGAGLVNQTIQFHGTADEYAVAAGTVVATLYSDGASSTLYPAVMLNTYGAGTTAVFTFDLAKSVVLTRQGNTAWAGQERDGQSPIRADDLFFGAASGDIKPDWIDLSRVAIPQADEQQRLLANIIVGMTAPAGPLPRFWYFPNGKKAVVVMTGDDHGNGGEVGRFGQFVSASAPGCVVDNWECIRGTAYIYPNTPITNTQVASFLAQGFEIALHVTMDPTTMFGCGSNYTPTTLANAYTTQLASFKSKWPAAGNPTTNRMHCLMWSDWFSQPTTELQNGIRLDTSYYYWPPTWINDTPGMFTGSGMPMRYASTTGSMIDVYQAVTQMTDESGQSYPFTIDTLLDNATGALGYYGAFTANMHNDSATSAGATAIVASAQARAVPVVSSSQMLKWLDGRNNSNFASIEWDGATLGFFVVSGTGATGLQVMLPTQTGTMHLTGLLLAGVPVNYSIQTIKGVQYAIFAVAVGHYTASYAP